MEVRNPYNNEVIGEVSLMSQTEVNTVLKNGKSSEKEMKELTGMERRAILKEIVEKIVHRKEAFVRTIIIESGKPRRYASAEVERAIQTFTIAAEESVRLPHELMHLDRSPKGRGLAANVIYEPLGLTFGISPFNFPLNLAAHKIAPAIATGCPIILKPSSKTPLTMQLLDEIIQETEIPEYAFQVINCSREVGNSIIKNEAIKLLTFTGSPEVGWEMKSNAGKKRVVLELGGNAATIICDDAEINQELVKDMLVGSFAYSGQVCIHTQRIYVHESNFENFIDLFTAETKKLKSEEPNFSTTDYSCMIDKKNVERIDAWVKSAIDKGTKLITGGEVWGNNSYAPTILTNVKKGLTVREEEVFGPVVIVEPFCDLEDAIEKVNDSKWGLQASIYTDKVSNLNRAVEGLNVGGVMHNLPTTFRVDEMPYGGIKESGFGREGIKYAMKDYLEAKLLVSSL